MFSAEGERQILPRQTKRSFVVILVLMPLSCSLWLSGLLQFSLACFWLSFATTLFRRY